MEKFCDADEVVVEVDDSDLYTVSSNPQDSFHTQCVLRPVFGA